MKKSRPSTTHLGDQDAVLSVLTNASLRQSIVQFQTGLPLHYQPILRDIRAVAASKWEPHRLIGAETFQEHSAAMYHVWFTTYGVPAVRVLQQTCARESIVYTSFIGHIVSLATVLPSMALSSASVDEQHELVWNFAARNGHLHVVQYLHMQQFPGCSTLVMDAAAANGHLDIVAFLHSYRTEGCTKEAMDAASFKGFLDVVRYLHFNRNEGCTKLAMTWAARLNQLDVVRFLSENRTEGCSRKALDWAAKYGHLNVVKYLLAHRHEGCPEHALLEAAKAGQMRVVRHLALHTKIMHPWIPHIMEDPSIDGDLAHIEAFVEQGDEVIEHVVEAALGTALGSGHTAIARYILVCCSQESVQKLI